MEYVRKGFRRVKNRIANRPSAVQKRYYLKLRAQLDPLRRPSDSGPNRPVLMISGITMRGTGIFCNLLAFLRWVDFAQRMGYIPVIDAIPCGEFVKPVGRAVRVHWETHIRS